jgi:histidinol-phosphate aminotransferase
VGGEALISALFKIKDSYNVDAVSQAVALAALSDLDHMRANVASIRRTRERLRAVLAAMGHAVYPSESNFLWVRPRGITARRLCEALQERKILVRHFPGERTGRFVRITVGTDRDVDKLIRAVREGCGP